MSNDDAERSIWNNPWVRTAGVLLVLGLLTVSFAMMDLEPDLSHVDVKVLSGSTSGNYHAVMERASEEAAKQSGSVENVSTRGSLDNVERLVASRSSCDVAFGMAQDGLPWPDEGLEVVARMPVSETVLFLGRDAASVHVVADLEGMTIGIGPEGSGTASLAAQLFASRGFGNLEVTLVHHPIAEQMRLVQSGALDLGVFVIAASASLIDTAIRDEGLQIASFEHARSIAEHLPIVRSEIMPAGYYDPFLVLPSEPRHVLVVDTLVLGNGCASRTETMGLLSVLEVVYPDIVPHNLQNPNKTGLPNDDAAQTYFANGGPDLLDRYAPWLANFIPLANLIQLAMVLSVGANLLTLWHKFRLWRIDALRVALERDTKELLGTNVPSDVRAVDAERLSGPEAIRALDRLIEGYVGHRALIRSHALSMLVPMGQELTYRHQEMLVEDRLAALRALRDRVGAQ